MEQANNEHFDIVFAGECLAGHDGTAVRAALGELFRANEATLDRLFSGTPQRIKADVDAPTARKYEKAMAAAGARAILRPVPGPTVSDPEGMSREPGGVDREAQASMTLAPPGSDVLRPDERKDSSADTVATDHLTLAPAGETLSDETPIVPDPHPGVDFDLAAVGTDLGDSSGDSAPAAPDTSGISLHDGDLDLSDCAPAPADPAVLDLDHLTVAAQGEDLLRESERVREDAAAPDTSHLSLSDPDAA